MNKELLSQPEIDLPHTGDFSQYMVGNLVLDIEEGIEGDFLRVFKNNEFAFWVEGRAIMMICHGIQTPTSLKNTVSRFC
jgi:hypothetical protein